LRLNVLLEGKERARNDGGDREASPTRHWCASMSKMRRASGAIST
jgi:hypothetical protein